MRARVLLSLLIAFCISHSQTKVAGAPPIVVPHFGKGELLSVGSGTRNQFEPSVATDGKGGVYVAWKDGQSGSSHVRFSWSHDFGQTWSKDVLMKDDKYKGQSDPVAMADVNGRVTVTWIAYNNFSDSAVLMAVSADRGASFATPTKQCLPTSKDSKDFFDREWQVMDGDEILTSYHVGNRIYVARSEDGGKSIEGTATPDGKNGGGVSAVMTRTPDGAIHIAWLHFGQSQAVRYSRSKDGGKTWEKPADVASMRPLGYRGRAQCFAAIANDSAGNLFLAWVEGKGRGKDDVAGHTMFIRSSDGGKTWSAPLRVSSADEHENGHKIQPWMNVDSRDRIHLAWLERGAGGLWTLQYALSTDRGLTFTAPIAACTPHAIEGPYHSDFIGVASDDKYVYVAAPLPLGKVYNMEVYRAPLAGVQYPAVAR